MNPMTPAPTSPTYDDDAELDLDFYAAEPRGPSIMMTTTSANDTKRATRDGSLYALVETKPLPDLLKSYVCGLVMANDKFPKKADPFVPLATTIALLS